MSASKRVLAATAIATLASLTACGSGSSSSAGSSVPSSSTTAMAAPRPGTQIGADQVRALLKGAFTNFTSVHEIMQISASNQDIKGVADLTKTSGGLIMQMTMTLPQVGDIEARLVDKAFYMKMNMPQLGGKWVKIDLSDPNSQLGQMMQSFTGMSPDRMFDQYAGGFQGATFIGTDSDGDHYELQIDSKAAMEHLPASLRDNPAVRQGMASLPATMKMNVWLSAGLLRKLSMVTGPLTVNVTLSDYGKAVSIVAPPSSEVTSAPGLS